MKIAAGSAASTDSTSATITDERGPRGRCAFLPGRRRILNVHRQKGTGRNPDLEHRPRFIRAPGCIFGPGSIFGEMSMLMLQQRTADAVCVTPARLLELDRRSLHALENQSPRLYAKMMRNLNVHIASRLDLATGLLRALQ